MNVRSVSGRLPLVLILLMFAAGMAGAQTITVGVGGWAVEPTMQAIEELEFTEKTGITVNVVTRPGSPPEFISQMTAAIMAGTSPYDVIDMEDDAAIPFSRAGWLEPLNDLFDEEFWQDWPDAMMEMVDLWNTYEGNVFRIPHNFEGQYFFYRKDILDAHGLSVPTTWDEIVEVGLAVTGDGVYAISDGLAKGAYLGVFMAYMTQQAGGNVYEGGEPLRTALQFVHDLMHEHKIMPVAALNKDYDAVNVDYTNDRVVMMRQWPFFYDVARSDPDWFAEDKVAIALPPAGPAGAYAYGGSWGWTVPTTAANVEAAKIFVEFMSNEENAGKLAAIDTWFLSARSSVMAEVGDQGIAPYLQMYDEAGVLSTRPFHTRFGEAQAVIEDAASAYLTNQISLDEAVRRIETRMAEL